MFSTTYDKQNRLWRGPDILPLYNPQISFAQALLNSMTIFKSKTAQISDNDGVQMSFDDIKTRTIRAAQNLQALGCKSKDVFTLIARNSHNVAPITFASIAIGCPISTLDASFGKTEIIHMFKITNTTVVFCDLACYELVDICLRELNNDARIFCFGGSVGRGESVESLFKETRRESDFIPVKVDGPNETAMILCSSGTTGLPKGVCVSHAALLDSMSRYDQDCSHVSLGFSSLYWASGVISLMHGTLCGATRIITTETFTPELQIHLIEKYKVTFISNAPHQLVLVMKNDRFSNADFSSVKYMLVGGSKVPYYVKTGMRPRLPNGFTSTTYGLSEVCGSISFDFPPKYEKDNAGRLCAGFCVKIIDEHGNKCGVNVAGEICIKMNYQFLGYFNNEKATKESFDAEGFVLTGDVGHFDEDGDLFVTGRQKELMKYCNYPIAPAEIDAFLTNSPQIKSACIVGIPDPMGELPAAVVIRAEGSTISQSDIFDMVAGHFADHYKLRGGVYFVDSLPTTPSGKVLRRKAMETAIERFNAHKG